MRASKSAPSPGLTVGAVAAPGAQRPLAGGEARQIERGEGGDRILQQDVRGDDALAAGPVQLEAGRAVEQSAVDLQRHRPALAHLAHARAGD
jgi:hypothetical protein